MIHFLFWKHFLNSMKYSKIHNASFDQQDLWSFLGFFPSCMKKKYKIETSPQNEKLNDLIAL